MNTINTNFDFAILINSFTLNIYEIIMLFYVLLLKRKIKPFNNINYVM